MLLFIDYDGCMNRILVALILTSCLFSTQSWASMPCIARNIYIDGDVRQRVLRRLPFVFYGRVLGFTVKGDNKVAIVKVMKQIKGELPEYILVRNFKVSCGMGALHVGGIYDFAVDFYDGSLGRADIRFRASDFHSWSFKHNLLSFLNTLMANLHWSDIEFILEKYFIISSAYYKRRAAIPDDEYKAKMENVVQTCNAYEYKRKNWSYKGHAFSARCGHCMNLAYLTAKQYNFEDQERDIVNISIPYNFKTKNLMSPLVEFKDTEGVFKLSGCKMPDMDEFYINPLPVNKEE